MRKIGNTLYFAFISFLFCSCNNKEITSGVQIKKLEYPSASAIEYCDGKLYVMGDDAVNMIVLDTNLNIVDSFPLFQYSERRIPKTIKHDIESIMFLKDSSKLLLLSSGSLSPYRDTAWLINLQTMEKRSISLTNYYQYLKTKGLKELNFEGATGINQHGFVFANRGHLGWPNNHLIFVSHLFLPESGDNAIMPVKFESDSGTFSGISGLTYASTSDMLILTVSTEATASSFEDGVIGKSYIWIIKHVGNIFDIRELTPDRIIDLEEIDKRFKGYKIESITMISETNELLNLVLVADNDDGSSTIFKLSIKKD